MNSSTIVSLLVGLTYGAGGAVAVAAAVEDVRSHRLPNTHTAAVAAIAVVGLTAVAAFDDAGLRWVSMALGLVVFAAPWLAIHIVSKGIGFGDVKLAAGLGLYLGWLDPWLALYAVIAVWLVFGASMVATRTGFGQRRPLGPALVAGVGATLLLGATTSWLTVTV